MEGSQGPRVPRPGLATTMWPALAGMARGSRLLAAFLALALIATATRVLPALAIGLVVDRVGANRAHATLAAIVAGLCALALAELALAAARDEAGLALRGRGAPAFPGSGADARAGAAVALELAEAATCVPVLALSVIGCLSLAGTRVAAAAACIALAYLVASAILVAARGEAAWRLHEAPRAGLAAAALALDRGRAAWAVSTNLDYNRALEHPDLGAKVISRLLQGGATVVRMEGRDQRVARARPAPAITTARPDYPWGDQ